MLENLNILDYLSSSEKEQLEFFCQERFLKSGEILFEEGDEANTMYFLKTGSISIDKTVNGKKLVLGRVVAEEIIGEMALFGKTGRRMGTAVALEDCELITVAYFSIAELTKKNPQLLSKIQNIIEERINQNKLLENKVLNNQDVGN